jgi:hypothetical protein
MVVAMTTIGDRVRTLEVRVEKLETWAGPGQADALSTGQIAIRTDIASFRREVKSGLTGLGRELAILRGDLTSLRDETKADIASLRSDIASLRSDLTSLRGILQEILRRLPPAEG